MLFFGGNYTLAREFLQQSGLMPKMLTRIAVLAPFVSPFRNG
jgi:hypothetical protein